MSALRLPCHPREEREGAEYPGMRGVLKCIMMAIKIHNVSCLVAINNHFTLCLHLKVCGQKTDLPVSH